MDLYLTAKISKNNLFLVVVSPKDSENVDHAPNRENLINTKYFEPPFFQRMRKKSTFILTAKISKNKLFLIVVSPKDSENVDHSPNR